MKQSDREERKRIIMQRRIRDIRNTYDMKWSLRQTLELTERCVNALGQEGLDDRDLTVLVRIFNREIIGREK